MSVINLKDLLETKIYCDTLENIPSSDKTIVNTINAHSYNIAKKDLDFAHALNNGDVLLPDGVGIVLAMRLIKGRKIKKISGRDLHNQLLKSANLNSLKVFYLGSSEKTLSLIQENIRNEFPNIKYGSYSPPYKKEFNEEDTLQMINAVNSFQPDYLFVGMTAPKQEKWVYRNSEKINAKLIGSIGAVFDFYAGTVKSPGEIWIKLSLEWLHRLINDPKNLWRRIFISAPKFFGEILSYKYLDHGFIKENY